MRGFRRGPILQGMRRALFAWLLVSMLAGTALADPVAFLYRGEVTVTGQSNLAERERGLREALGQVLVKVSGDAGLLGDSRLGPLLDRAATLVRDFSYEDRLARKKLMDEQGARERSYWLRVDFDPAAVDSAPAALGGRPWGAERPRLLVLLAVTDSRGDYLLTARGERGFGQREAFTAIAARRGLPLVLPETGDPASARDPVGAAALAARHGAAMVLSGEMALTGEGAWRTEWRLAPAGGPWLFEPTTFDRAIAQALEKAGRIMAGLP